ncbi:MAG: proton-conducting transporter membrane subunit [Xanthomonadales bacterium]|nr:proton-conducting transporter membrane subunit [Xanthomonadales bacterium]
MLRSLLTNPMALPVVFPLLAGLVCLLLPNAASRLRVWLAALAAIVVLAFVWPLFQQAGQTWNPLPWLTLRTDLLSVFILLGVAFFGLVVAVYSVGYMKDRPHQRAYFTYLLWTLGISCGVVLANDLLILLVCWGFLALILYLMAGLSGPGAAEAARKSLMIIGGSDALMLLGILIYWHLAGTTRMDGAALALDGPLAYMAFLTLLAGAFAKAGAVPFHSWVPSFGEKVDAPVSAFLPASLDKLLGIYLLTRLVLDLFIPTPGMYGMLMLLGAVTVIAAVLMALVQHDLKRLLSFHAVSQVGYMILGIGTGTAIGLAGGLFHMLNNTVYKSALFLGAGMVEKQTGTTDLDRLGGLAKLMPVTFIVCTIAALSISGIPPLNGFASKWMIYQGIISSGDNGSFAWVLWLAVAMLGSALTLASFVKVLHATFLCKPSVEIRQMEISEKKGSMLLPMIVLALLCVVFGVYAFQVPLGFLIFPVVAVTVPGVWWSGLATVLILLAVIVGIGLYWLTMRGGKLRRMRTYIGGEQMQDVYLSNDEPGPLRHVEVTGVDFYDTIEQVPGLHRYYALMKDRVFDIYEFLKRSADYFVQMLRALHTGILPSYLRWFVAGLLLVVWVVTMEGR